MHAAETLANWASSRLRWIGRAVVDGVLPPRCLACGETIGEPDALCGRCWRGITFFAPLAARRLRIRWERTRYAGPAPANGAAGIARDPCCATTSTAGI